MKKVFTFFVLIFVSSLAFPLEFRLEYEQRLSFKIPRDAFFISDSDILFAASSNSKLQLFILNYETGEITDKSVSFIEDYVELSSFTKYENNNVFLFSYSDAFSKSYKDYKYALVNIDTNTYKSLTGQEYSSLIKTIKRFNYEDSNPIHGDYQLWCYSDAEVEDVAHRTWWAEDCWYKIAFIRADSILGRFDFGGIKNEKITEYVQTLKDQDGYDLIVREYGASITYDPEREKLIIISDVDYVRKEEAALYKYTLYIYKLIYDATCNDTRVRIREEPNLSCSTLGYLNAGDAVKVTDKSDAPFEIDGESWYWYKVESDTLPPGWVYGKYLDIEE